MATISEILTISLTDWDKAVEMAQSKNCPLCEERLTYYKKAVELCAMTQRESVPFIQRCLCCSYKLAVSIEEQLIKDKIIDKSDLGNGIFQTKVLIKISPYTKQLMN